MKKKTLLQNMFWDLFCIKTNRRCQSGRQYIIFPSGFVAIDAPLWLAAAPPQGLDVLGPHPGVSGQSGLAHAQTQQPAHDNNTPGQPASTTYVKTPAKNSH